MIRRLIILLLIVGCDNSTESSVHPLIGVWNALEGTAKGSDGIVIDTIVYDENNSVTWIFGEDKILSSITVDEDVGSLTASSIWSVTGNKLTIVSQSPHNSGATMVYDYSISGTILTMSGMLDNVIGVTFVTTFQKQ